MPSTTRLAGPIRRFRQWPAAARGATLLAFAALLAASHPLLDGHQAKYIHIRWTPEVSAGARRALERRFALRVEAGEGRSFGYDLLDDSTGNIRALLQHPAVEDSDALDRARFTVAANAEDGDSRTGLAWRWGVEAILPLFAPLGAALVIAGGTLLLQAALGGWFFHGPVRAAAGTGPPARLAELDALRGIAVLAVVFFHFTTRFAEKYGHPSPPLIHVPLGHYGVQLFFVISGMVIFLTLERTRSAADFVVARVGRLYPAYWVALSLTFAAITLVGLPGAEASTSQYAWNLSMAQRFIDVHDVDGAYWSLQVELAFYLLMLGLLALRALPLIEPILIVWLLILSVDAATGMVARVAMGSRAVADFVGLYGYADLFVLGIVFHLRRTRGISPALLLALVGALAFHASQSTWESTAIVFVIAAVFEAAIRGRLGWLAVRPLLFFGGISYPLYLIHQNLGFVALRRLYGVGVPANLAILTVLLLVVALATLLHHGVEGPGQTLAGRLRRFLRGAESPKISIG